MTVDSTQDAPKPGTIAWLERTNVPASEKPSGAQRRREMQGKLVMLTMRKPRKPRGPKPKRPAPDVQIARGPITSETYQAVKAAYKQRKPVQYKERLYRVAYVRANEVGNFEARLVEVVT